MTCRACKGQLNVFLDLGRQYLSDFRRDDSRPPRYPLTVAICDSCLLVQLTTSTPRHKMYHENYGFKSSISDSIIIDLDDIVTHAYQYKPDPRSWLDIGSNDGTLLSFVPTDVYRVGVDPVKFLCDEAEQYADKIINDYYSGVPGQFDVITTISCFYDMPDLQHFVLDVINNLAHRGIWVIQQNYLLTTMQLGAVDNFCHEHLTYFTLLSLEKLLHRFGLEINEVELSNVNGGVIRTIVSRQGDFPVDPSVYRQRLAEEDYGLDKIGTYEYFAEHSMDNVNQLIRLITDLKISGKSIAILGASTRGSTIWQSAELGPKQIDYAVERNPAKVGRQFSAIKVPIISETEARLRKPDYMIIGPWFFADEIIDREKEYLDAGGRLIVPLPEVEIIDGNR